MFSLVKKNSAALGAVSTKENSAALGAQHMN